MTTLTAPALSRTVTTHVKFLDNWTLAQVTAANDATPEQIKQILIDAIAQREPLTPVPTQDNFRIIGQQTTFVPDFLSRTIVEYVR